MPDQLAVGVSGSYKYVNTVGVGVGGVYKDVPEVFVGVGGVWERVFIKLTASASPTSASAAQDVTTTNLVTITPAGGTSPYTYAWSRISSTTNAENVSNATAQAVTFNDPVLATSTSASWRCVVTDNVGATVEVTVSVTFAGPST